MKTKVKTYNGCNIYVHFDGTFYCDPINNSDEYKNAGIKSEKLSSVEKAIDNYETNGKTFVNKYIVIAAIFIVYPMSGIALATGHWVEFGLIYFGQMPLLINAINKL